MKLRVTNIQNDNCEAWPIVRFECASGIGKAVWKSQKIHPEINAEYSAELDIECVGHSIRIHRDRVHQPISHSTDNVTLRGSIESVDNDGLGYLRLSNDCLVMLDAVSPELVGAIVELTVAVAELTVYAHGISS
jgi:hypothetical protein